MYKNKNKPKEVLAKNSKKSKEELKVDLSAQRTYGHFTFEALYSMIDYMQKATMIDKLIPLEDEYQLCDQSTFLDIGSGFGYPCFMAAFLTDCLSVGLEILHLRCQTSIEAKEAIQKSKLLNKDGWVRRVTFSYENATHNSKNPFTNFRSHTTHIFSYNYIQVNHDLFMQPIVKRLNKTDFKLLAWCAD